MKKTILFSLFLAIVGLQTDLLMAMNKRTKNDSVESTQELKGNSPKKLAVICFDKVLNAVIDEQIGLTDALNGMPGIFSARWAGPGKDFALAMARVQQRLEETGSDDVSAFFSCALAVAWPKGGPIVAVEGRIDGTLTFPPRGTLGFGYDPIFIPEGGVLTFGEMDPAAKDAISHRARAFAQLKAALF